MSATKLNTAIEDHVRALELFPGTGTDGFCLSFNCVEGIKQTWVASIARRPNPQFCWLTVQDIRDAGFEISATKDSWHDASHCDVFLSSGITERPSLEQLEELSKKFSQPTENPVRPR